MAARGKMTALNTAIREVLPHLAETSYEQPARGGARPGDRLLHRRRLARRGAHRRPTTSSGQDLRARRLHRPRRGARPAAHGADRAADGGARTAAGGRAGLRRHADRRLRRGAMARLLALPWGARAVRMAVAIGQDADYDTLARSSPTPSIEPVTASNPEQLLMALRWATVHVARAASSWRPPAHRRAGRRPGRRTPTRRRCGERVAGHGDPGCVAGAVSASRRGSSARSGRAEPGRRSVRRCRAWRDGAGVGGRRRRRSRRRALRPLATWARSSRSRSPSTSWSGCSRAGGHATLSCCTQRRHRSWSVGGRRARPRTDHPFSVAEAEAGGRR